MKLFLFAFLFFSGLFGLIFYGYWGYTTPWIFAVSLIFLCAGLVIGITMPVPDDGGKNEQ